MSLVTPVMGEVGRYRVASRTHPDQTHLVDIVEGQCGCASYVCKRRERELATGLPYRCYHLKAARQFALECYIEEMRNHLAAQ